MKKSFLCILSIGLLFFSIQVFGQKTVVVVEPDAEGTTGALNNAITAAADPGNTIFELRRGGHYEMNNSFRPSFTLHIRAEAGVGPRPVVQAASGKQHFLPSADIILEGLYLTQMASDGTYNGSQAIKVRSGDCRVIVDNCVFDYVQTGFIRLDGSNSKVYITNSVFRNGMELDDWNGSKIVECRGLPQDTVSIQYSTIYNLGGKLIHELDVAVTNVVIFNHNTVFHSSYDDNINLGMTLKATVTNNLFYNFALVGHKDRHDPLFEIDSVGTEDDQRTFNLSNNNWMIDPGFSEILAKHAPDPNFEIRNNLLADQEILDTAAWTKPVALWFLENGQVDTTGFINEYLSFYNPMDLELDYWRYFVENGYNAPGPVEVIPDAFVYEEDSSLVYSYGDNSMSATGAIDGSPLGDPRWIPNHVTVVEPDSEGTTGALNTAITSQAEPWNTIFELRRGGHYEMSDHIRYRNPGQQLHIRAEAGPGPRPVVQAASGKRHFRMEGTPLILESLYLDLMASDNTYNGGQSIRVDAAEVSVIVDDCVFDYAQQGFIRLESSDNKIYVTNSVFRNGMEPDDANGSKIIENQDNPQDILSIQFSTIYNHGGKMVFDLGSASANKVIFNHNTVYQGGYDDNFNLGKAMNADVTNNIFYNYSLAAYETRHDPFFSIDSLGTGDDTRMFNLRNNNWMIDKAYADTLNKYAPDPTFELRNNLFADQSILDTAAWSKPIALYFIENGQVDSSNNFSEMLWFRNPCSDNLAYWKYFVENGYESPLPIENIPDPFVHDNHYNLDLGYNNNSVSATAAEGGTALGDPRWALYTLPARSLTITVDPTDAGTATGEGSYVAGTTVALTATANTGYEFVNWTDAMGNEVTIMDGVFIMPNEDVALKANFKESTAATYTLTLEANPAGAGTLTGAGDYEAGTAIAITATANSGYEFVKWTDASGNDVTLTNGEYTMPAENVTLTANFQETAPETYTLTLEVNPANAGTVSGAGEYEAGEDVTITATASADFEFVKWTDASGNDVTLTEGKYNMPAEDVTLTAQFQSTVGIGSSVADRMKVYPNPGNGLFQLEYAIDGDEKISLEVMSLTGEVVYSQVYKQSSDISETIDLQFLAKGIYFMKLKGDGTMNTLKLIIK